MKWYPVVPGLAALPLIFEQGGQPSIAKESTLPDDVIRSVGVSSMSLISVLQTQKQNCCSPYSVSLEYFLSCCFAPIHRKSSFSQKNSILSDASCCQRSSNLLSTLPSKSNRIWAANSLSHLRGFPFSLEDFLASVLGSCVTPAAGDNGSLSLPCRKRSDLIERPTL